MTDYDDLTQWERNQCHEQGAWNPHAFSLSPQTAQGWAFARSFQGFVLLSINLCMCIAGFRNRLYSNNASNTITLVFSLHYTIFGVLQTASQLLLAFNFSRNLAMCRVEAAALCLFVTAKVMLLLLASYERGISVLHLRKVSPSQIFKGVIASYIAALGSAIAHHVASPCPVIGASGTLCWPNFGAGTMEMAVLTYMDLGVIGGNVIVVMGVYSAIVRRLRTVFIRLSKKANALSHNLADDLQGTKERLTAYNHGIGQANSGQIPPLGVPDPTSEGFVSLTSPVPSSPGGPDRPLVSGNDTHLLPADSHRRGTSATAAVWSSAPHHENNQNNQNNHSSAMAGREHEHVQHSHNSHIPHHQHHHHHHHHHVQMVEEEPEPGTKVDQHHAIQPAAQHRFHTQVRQPRPASLIVAKSERRRSALPLATPTSRRESVMAWPMRQSVMDHFGALLTGSSPKQGPIASTARAGSISSTAASIAPSARSRASSGKTSSVKGSQATSVSSSSHRISPTVGRAAGAAFWPNHRISISESTSDRSSIRPASLQVSEEATIGSDCNLDAIFDDEEEVEYEHPSNEQDTSPQHGHHHEGTGVTLTLHSTAATGSCPVPAGSSSGPTASLKSSSDGGGGQSNSLAHLLHSGNTTMTRSDAADTAPGTPASITANRPTSDPSEAVDSGPGGGGFGSRSYMRLKSISFLGSKTKNAVGPLSFSLKPKEGKQNHSSASSRHVSGSTTPNKSRAGGFLHHHHHHHHKNAHKLQMLKIESHLVRRGLWVIASFSISWAFIICQILWAFTTQRRVHVDLEIVITLAAFFSPLLDPIAIMYVDTRWRKAVFSLFPSCGWRPKAGHHASTGQHHTVS